jgi:hypothetical protein
MIYSKQKIFCNCCGKEMDIEFPNVMGGKFLGYRVCSTKCIQEIRWRETLSILGKEYYPNPQTENS